MLISDTKLLILDSTLNRIRVVDSNTGNIDSEYNFPTITNIIDIAIDYKNKKVWTLSKDSKINRFRFEENDNVVSIIKEATITVNFYNSANFYAGKSLAVNEENGDLYYLYKPNGTMTLYRISIDQADGTSVTTGGINISRPNSSSNTTGAILIFNPDESKLYIFHSFYREYDLYATYANSTYYIRETSTYSHVPFNLTIVDQNLTQASYLFYLLPLDIYNVNLVHLVDYVKGSEVAVAGIYRHSFDVKTGYYITTIFNPSYYDNAKKSFILYFDSIYLYKTSNGYDMSSLYLYSCIFDIKSFQNRQKNKVIYYTTTNNNQNLMNIINDNYGNYILSAKDCSKLFIYDFLDRYVEINNTPINSINFAPQSNANYIKFDKYTSDIYIFEGNRINKRTYDFGLISSIMYANSIYNYFILPSSKNLRENVKAIKYNKDNVIFRLQKSNSRVKLKLYVTKNVHDNYNFKSSYLVDIGKFKYIYKNEIPDYFTDEWTLSESNILQLSQDYETYVLISLKDVNSDIIMSNEKYYVYLHTEIERN